MNDKPSVASWMWKLETMGLLETIVIQYNIDMDCGPLTNFAIAYRNEIKCRIK